MGRSARVEAREAAGGGRWGVVHGRVRAVPERRSAPVTPSPVAAAPTSAPVLVVVCVWAVALVVVGLAVGVAAVVAMVRRPPGWYPPAVIAAGVFGVVLTAAALGAAVDSRRLRWVLLGAATAALVAVVMMTRAAG